MDEPTRSVVRLDRLTVRDGVALADEEPASAYRARWEDEAAADPVASATAGATHGEDDLETLTRKLTPIWDRFPAGRHVETLLDVGVGYGRVELFLSERRGLRCDTFCAVDISETMLRRLLEFRERFDALPGATVWAIRASADRLPLEDASVDLALSSTAFLHMGKAYVSRTLAEIARVLKPGGGFVFDGSFPNPANPSNWVQQLKPPRYRSPHALKYWTRDEIERAVVASGLAARAGGFRIEPSTYALLPKEVGPVPVPFARRANAALGAPRRLDGLLAVVYSVYSPGALED
jgi:SAM-dependent methyltransferase